MFMERGVLCSAGLSIASTWAGLLQESCIFLCPAFPPALHEGRAGCVMHCCSANVSNKISRRSGQLFLHTEGSQWLLEPRVSPATAALGVVSKENPSAYKEVKEPLLAIEGAQRE